MCLISEQLHAALVGSSSVLPFLKSEAWSANSVGARDEAGVGYSTPGAGIICPRG